MSGHMTYREAAKLVRKEPREPGFPNFLLPLSGSYERATVLLAKLGSRTDGPDRSPLAVGDLIADVDDLACCPVGTSLRHVNANVVSIRGVNGWSSSAGSRTTTALNLPARVIDLPDDADTADDGARTDGPDRPVAVGDRLASWSEVMALPSGTFVQAANGDRGVRNALMGGVGECNWAGTDGPEKHLPVTVVSLPGDPLPPEPTP